MHDPLPPLRDIINKYELRAKKSFGQNFLMDLNLTRKIARIPGDLSNAVAYEVGPGPGGLTRALLMEGAARVQAAEMDMRCEPVLQEVSGAFNDRLSVHFGDALDVDEVALIAANPDQDIHIVSNLPYNVGTLLLIRWLTVPTWTPWYKSLTLMFQKEVAERIVAKPGTKAYGRLSILAQWRCKARIALTVPAAAFTPPPKVTSAVIHLVPKDPADADLKLPYLEKVVELAFGQRRKMLRASLKGLPVDQMALLEMAAIEPTRRAETLSVDDFVRLGRCYQNMLTD